MKLSPALRFLSNQVWAVHPPVFTSLAALLEAHANGERAAAIPGDAASAQEAAPQIIGNVGVVSVRGVLARYADQINGACQDTGRSAESLQNDLRTLAADPRVARIVLRIDSPGGTVAGTAETGDVIRSLGKPVTAFVDGMAASAGYWLASQADEIVMAGPTSEVGSIGVITAAVDATRANERAGYRVTVFRTSPLKAPGAMGEQLTREQAQAIERDLADFHAAFASAVQMGRGLTDAQLAAATTGEMWRPEQAIAMGLADRVATWEQVVGSSAPIQAPGASRADDFAPSASTTTAAAIQAQAPATEEPTVDPKLMATLTALCQVHPTHAAALVVEANKPGASDATLHAFVAKAEGDAIRSAYAAEQTAHAATKASLAELTAKHADLQAKHDKLAALANKGAKDPGAAAGDTDPVVITREQYAANPGAYAEALRLRKARLAD